MFFVDGGNDCVVVGGSTVETADQFEVLGNDSNTFVRFRNTNAGAGGPVLVFDKSSASPANDDVLGELRFLGKDSGGNADQYAGLKVESGNVTAGGEDAITTYGQMVDGSYRNMFTINHVGTTFNEGAINAIDFRVEAGSKTHMLFVDSENGFVGIANNNRVFSSTELLSIDGNDPGIGINVSTAAEQAIGIIQSATSTTNFMLRFDNGSGAIGSITHNGSVTAYNTSSDERIKENIQDAEDAGELIDSIQVRQFDWKIGGKHQRYGMIAQELNLVAPEACAMGDGDKDIAAVDYSILVPMLVKEIQTLRARIEKLEGE